MVGEDAPAEGTLWRHYKGTVYVVVGYAMRESDKAPLILYRGVAADPSDHPWSRPLSEWFASPRPGFQTRQRQRFERVT